MEGWTDHALVVLFYGSVLGYLLGLLLESKSFGHLLAEIWARASETGKRPLKQEVLALGGRFLGVVYEKGGRVSVKKLFLISFLLNVPLLIGTVELFTKDNSLRYSQVLMVSDQISVMLIAALVGNITNEYFSYSITNWFYKKAIKRNLVSLLVLEVVVLLLVFYLVPLVLIFGLKSNVFIGEYWAGMFLFPSMTTALIMMSTNASKLILMVPALSVCLPSTAILLAVFSVYNKPVISGLAKGAELIGGIDGKQLKTGSLILFTFVTGFMTYLSLPQS